MIIDFHTHTFPDPIADAAIDRLSRQANITAYTCGTAAGLLLAERAAGVDRSIILPVATKPEQVHHINDYAAAHNKHAFVTNMFSFGCIHPDYEDWKQELDRLAAANMRGVKIHPAYQQTDLDDPKYLRILERAGTLGLIVVTHAGYDIGFPGCACCTPEKARSALRQVGPVKLVLAHMGGWRCWEQVPELLADTSALLDTSFSLGSLTPRDEALPLDRQMLSDEAFVSGPSVRSGSCSAATAPGEARRTTCSTSAVCPSPTKKKPPSSAATPNASSASDLTILNCSLESKSFSYTAGAAQDGRLLFCFSGWSRCC